MAGEVHGLGRLVYETPGSYHGHGHAVFHWLDHVGSAFAPRLYSARRQLSNAGVFGIATWLNPATNPGKCRASSRPAFNG